MAGAIRRRPRQMSQPKNPQAAAISAAKTHTGQLERKTIWPFAKAAAGYLNKNSNITALRPAD